MPAYNWKQIVISLWKKKNLLVSCMGFWFYLSCWLGKLRICSCLARVYRVMNARGKFGEHKKCVGVARGVAEISSSFLSALQASQVHPLYSISAQLKAWANSFITERQQGSARRSLLLRILTTPKKIKQTSLLAGQKHATFITLVPARTCDPVDR